MICIYLDENEVKRLLHAIGVDLNSTQETLKTIIEFDCVSPELLEIYKKEIIALTDLSVKFRGAL